jgi:hypothetical protein
MSQPGKENNSKLQQQRIPPYRTSLSHPCLKIHQKTSRQLNSINTKICALRLTITIGSRLTYLATVPTIVLSSWTRRVLPRKKRASILHSSDPRNDSDKHRQQTSKRTHGVDLCWVGKIEWWGSKEQRLASSANKYANGRQASRGPD